MNIISVCGFCIASVIACKAVESDNREIKQLLVLAVSVLLFISAAGFISQLLSVLSSLFDSAKISDVYIKIIFKCLGIAYISKFASDYCKDCGENTIASQVILVGKISVVVVSMPLLKAFTALVKGLIA